MDLALSFKRPPFSERESKRGFLARCPVGRDRKG